MRADAPGTRSKRVPGGPRETFSFGQTRLILPEDMTDAQPIQPGAADPRGAPRVPAGHRYYVVGDIHGRADLLDRMHEMIATDRDAAPPGTRARRNAIVYLGDYVDRGPGSFEVVECLVRAPLGGFESVFLKGNHEDFLLEFLADGSGGDVWMMNGGAATLLSYGVDVPGAFMDAQGLGEARRRFRETVPADHLAFFQSLRTYYVAGDYLFVHAGVMPGIALEDQAEFDLLWIREDFLDHDSPSDKVVVHGHSISPAPEVRAGRIGIDTGAWHSGCLTCLILEDEARRFLQT